MIPSVFRDIRKTLGLSAREMAEALGVHERTVYKWEHGERTISGPVALLMQRLMAEKKS